MSAALKYLVPNGFTGISLLCGLGSVIASIQGDFSLAAWLILFGVLLDKLDGASARMLNATSEFGMQFDSFADFVVFGIAPAMLFYLLLAPDVAFQGANEAILWAASGAYVLATATRLARFNISKPPLGDHYFYGIPTTLVGGILGALYLTLAAHGAPRLALLCFPIYLLVGAALMVSNVLLPKLRARKNKAFNAFQIANIVATYVFITFRILPEYTFALGILYMIVGAGYCVVWPPEVVGTETADGLDSREAPVS